MDFFPWKPEYSVGLPRMDGQHMQLVGILNRLYADMVGRKAKDSLSGVFDELVTYTANHFASEEDLFAKYAYPGAAAHKAEHDDLVREVLDYRKKLEADGWVTPLSVTNFLKGWLSDHILRTDKAYTAFLVSKGAS
ncbi:MAG: bacteriohemerythrin [Spirochaetota bacterium]